MVRQRPLSFWLMSSLIAFSAASIAAKPFKVIGNKGGQETCLQAAQARWPGDATKLEFKHKHGLPVYEIEITGKGRTLEFECDANTGQLIAEEQEVGSPDDPLFKAKAKLGVAEAARIALQAHPGKVVETEFEIKANGDPTYEFDIETEIGRAHV